MTGNELRSGFLRFFADRGHRVVASSPLIPQDDPTLLFANAGMNQFKDIFLGRRAPEFRRASSSQKCIRAGGKHNDLEDVGKDGTHHTFFEMLGNWSFGDYYKAEAIAWAWEYLTVVLGLPPDRLRATVHHTDDEAEEIWLRVTGMPKEHVSRHGDKDNFWEMAEVGPCGPCSEIHLDLGADRGCRRSDCGPNCTYCESAHDSRFMELWNLVFIQYNRDEQGTLTTLPAKHVDTGLGFERILSVIQGTSSNYDTDIFAPILHAIERISGQLYTGGHESTPFRIIADHIRALTMAITDGGFPSNVGRGYVLRRILRRASRAGRQLGLVEPFLHHLTDAVADAMGEAYPEVIERHGHVANVIRQEEERFGRTLNRGIDQFEEIAGRLEKDGANVIPGDRVFQLYDTFGVPIDLTALMAEERGMALDMAGYDRLMAEQRKRSRGQAKFDQVALAVGEDLASEFVGYDTMSTTAQVIGVGEGAVVLDQTPFYAESGGQVSDQGTISNDESEFMVEDVCRQGDAIIHIGRITRGTPTVGMAIRAEVDRERREATMRNHSATHLLHAALRATLGGEVHQAGSLVAPDRLRFDFTSDRGPTEEEVEHIEEIVNARIRDDLPVTTTYASLDEARAAGAMALFGEKYGETVRVVSMGDWSKELCGGTHVRATGQIGFLRITGESSIAAGTRRIEAVTGAGAETLAREEHRRLERIGHLLKASPEEAEDRVRALAERLRELERDLERTREMMASTDVDRWIAQAGEINGAKVLVQEVPAADAKAFRAIGDAVREKLGRGVAVLASGDGDKLSLMVVVTDNLVEAGVKAGDLIRGIGELIGARGGGRPHMAQAGGGDPAKLPMLLAKAPEIIEKALV